MRGSKTERADAFEKRLKQTMGTETDPEMYTPNTAGSEELSEYDDTFPLVRIFNSTNMRSGGRRIRDGQTQSGREND